jgi:hypothetical protein
MIEVDNYDSYGINRRQAEIVNLIERGVRRAEIAVYLGITPQSARDIIGVMCDSFDCPTGFLPQAVQLRVRDMEIVEILDAAYEWMSDDDFDPSDEWIADLLKRTDSMAERLDESLSRSDVVKGRRRRKKGTRDATSNPT